MQTFHDFRVQKTCKTQRNGCTIKKAFLFFCNYIFIQSLSLQHALKFIHFPLQNLTFHRGPYELHICCYIFWVDATKRYKEVIDNFTAGKLIILWHYFIKLNAKFSRAQKWETFMIIDIWNVLQRLGTCSSAARALLELHQQFDFFKTLVLQSYIPTSALLSYAPATGENSSRIQYLFATLLHHDDLGSRKFWDLIMNSWDIVSISE